MNPTDAPEDTDAETEMVDVHEAAIEDLDAALQNAKTAEEAEAPATDDAPATGETDEAPIPQKPDGQEGETPSVAPTGAAPSKPAAMQAQAQGKVQGQTADDARQKQSQKELFIQHRGNELGQLRAQNAEQSRQLNAAKAALMEGLNDRFSENPSQAIADRDRVKEIDQQIERLEQQEARAERIVEAQTFFLRHVDTEKVSVDDIAEVLKSDGMTDDIIGRFKANPWEFTSSEALVQFGKRAEDRKRYTEADSDRRVLAKHVLAQNAEIERLKKRPGQVLQHVQRNLNQSPAMTAAQSATPKTAKDLDPTRMSVAELDAALKHAMSH